MESELIAGWGSRTESDGSRVFVSEKLQIRREKKHKSLKNDCIAVESSAFSAQSDAFLVKEVEIIRDTLMEKTARDSKKNHLMSLGGLPQGLCHQISNLEFCALKKYLPRSESFPVEFRVDKLPSRMNKSG